MRPSYPVSARDHHDQGGLERKKQICTSGWPYLVLAIMLPCRRPNEGLAPSYRGREIINTPFMITFGVHKHLRSGAIIELPFHCRYISAIASALRRRNDPRTPCVPQTISIRLALIGLVCCLGTSVTRLQVGQWPNISRAQQSIMEHGERYGSSINAERCMAYFEKFKGDLLCLASWFSFACPIFDLGL